MNESIYEQIREASEYLHIDFEVQEIATFALTHQLGESEMQAISNALLYLKNKKQRNQIDTLLKLSRLPLKEPKSFENFDFSLLHGKNAESIQNLSALGELYAHKNLAFIGPPGVGKTHLAMAYGRACCEQGLKTYFLKATELNQRLMDARKYGHESAVINGLVRPSCLIIDEVGRCVFDIESTRMFFDVIDRRYNKEGPNLMIFTSNKSADKWKEYFSEDSSLLCALDRIFDDATVYMIKGNSYRGRKLSTVSISAGTSGPLIKTQN